MMNGQYAIEVRNLSKSFRVYHERKSTLFEHLAGMISKKMYHETLNVLNDISFDVKKGEMMGIIAKNGQGKTTLLQIMSKILRPDSGTVKLRGSIVPFLGLGSGFLPDLTAAENIILHGLFLGLPKGLIEQKVPEVLGYAELERFADTKIRYFSTGMYSRLAFATGVQVDPDILLVDEVLAVGDIEFQEKSFQTFLSFKKRGKTIVFVTHNMEQLKRLCDRALFIHNGRIQKIGHPSEVVSEFYKMIHQR